MANMQGSQASSRAVERRYWRSMGFLLLSSVALALASRTLPLSLATPIPVANFYDRVSGTSANGFYFFGMYVVSLAVLSMLTSAFRSMIVPGLPLDRRVLGGLVFWGASAFFIYLCALMPATTKAGGGRFSALLLVSAHWPLAFGLIYGVFFFAGVSFLGLAIASALGSHPAADTQ